MQPEQVPEPSQGTQTDPNAAALGRPGGQTRMARLSGQERSALASMPPARVGIRARRGRRENAPRRSSILSNKH
jgi:hypothetical protein